MICYVGYVKVIYYAESANKLKPTTATAVTAGRSQHLQNREITQQAIPRSVVFLEKKTRLNLTDEFPFTRG